MNHSNSMQQDPTTGRAALVAALDRTAHDQATHLRAAQARVDRRRRAYDELRAAVLPSVLGTLVARKGEEEEGEGPKMIRMHPPPAAGGSRTEVSRGALLVAKPAVLAADLPLRARKGPIVYPGRDGRFTVAAEVVNESKTETMYHITLDLALLAHHDGVRLTSHAPRTASLAPGDAATVYSHARVSGPALAFGTPFSSEGGVPLGVAVTFETESEPPHRSLETLLVHRHASRRAVWLTARDRPPMYVPHPWTPTPPSGGNDEEVIAVEFPVVAVLDVHAVSGDAVLGPLDVLRWVDPSGTLTVVSPPPPRSGAIAAVLAADQVAVHVAPATPISGEEEERAAWTLRVSATSPRDILHLLARATSSPAEQQRVKVRWSVAWAGAFAGDAGVSPRPHERLADAVRELAKAVRGAEGVEGVVDVYDAAARVVKEVERVAGG
ncbi:hypothetical protein H9P43_008319 [Blastocladiella emersonii ATCC 22665]|nr:hypothetical protein H9P43_008319 [Blastocladiella emersonii ATCC 22665]